MERAPPGAGGAHPCPSLARPACLSLGCPLLKKLTSRGSRLLLPRRVPCCPVACALGGVAFLLFLQELQTDHLTMTNNNEQRA